MHLRKRNNLKKASGGTTPNADLDQVKTVPAKPSTTKNMSRPLKLDKHSYMAKTQGRNTGA